MAIESKNENFENQAQTSESSNLSSQSLDLMKDFNSLGSRQTEDTSSGVLPSLSFNLRDRPNLTNSTDEVTAPNNDVDNLGKTGGRQTGGGDEQTGRGDNNTGSSDAKAGSGDSRKDAFNKNTGEGIKANDHAPSGAGSGRPGLRNSDGNDITPPNNAAPSNGERVVKPDGSKGAEGGRPPGGGIDGKRAPSGKGGGRDALPQPRNNESPRRREVFL